MGRDKALLPVPPSGEPLWERQLDLLSRLGPEELLWSGPLRVGVPAAVREIRDPIADAGPLAGISACLEASRSDLLVVLAIDLPAMTGAFLRGLLARAACGWGVVTQGEGGGSFEPLAAVYPRSLAPLAAERLARGEYALHGFIREGIDQGALEVVSLRAGENAFFRNLNTPDDLASFLSQP